MELSNVEDIIKVKLLLLLLFKTILLTDQNFLQLALISFIINAKVQNIIS